MQGVGTLLGLSVFLGGSIGIAAYYGFPVGILTIPYLLVPILTVPLAALLIAFGFERTLRAMSSQALLAAELDRPGLFPRLETLANESFIFNPRFGLDRPHRARGHLDPRAAPIRKIDLVGIFPQKRLTVVSADVWETDWGRSLPVESYLRE